MGTIGFYIFYGINWIITLLPLKVLYVFSDLLFILLYYFPSYRRKIVADNLKNSFPEKSDKERFLIEKEFYRHLADLFIETLKLTHLSKKELTKRITFSNPSLLEYLYNSGRDIALVHSHYNNWEWLECLPLYTKYKVITIYKPLRSKLFNNFLNGLRSRHGMGLSPMTHIVREIVENRRRNVQALYGFVADQTPAKPDIRYRTTFMNQDTPVFLGIEKLAVKYDMAVVFLYVQKIKRGYYRFSVELLFEQTRGLPEHLVTDTHVKRLEELIREKPEYWIWTHRRWKY
ncbi:MAG: lysophospholipid acyltransferase family protein [Bacteroidales bacterium]